jgi:hypothetical protein
MGTRGVSNRECVEGPNVKEGTTRRHDLADANQCRLDTARRSCRRVRSAQSEPAAPASFRVDGQTDQRAGMRCAAASTSAVKISSRRSIALNRREASASPAPRVRPALPHTAVRCPGPPRHGLQRHSGSHLAPREPAAAPGEEAEHTGSRSRQRDPANDPKPWSRAQVEIDEMRLVAQRDDDERFPALSNPPTRPSSAFSAVWGWKSFWPGRAPEAAASQFDSRDELARCGPLRPRQGHRRLRDQLKHLLGRPAGSWPPPQPDKGEFGGDGTLQPHRIRRSADARATETRRRRVPSARGFRSGGLIMGSGAGTCPMHVATILAAEATWEWSSAVPVL